MSTETCLTLKWGTLKTWNFPKGSNAHALLVKWSKLGSSASAMMQDDTPEQKELICQMIDECDGDTIYLDWDGKDVSKDEAKKYVRDYPAMPRVASAAQ